MKMKTLTAGFAGVTIMFSAFAGEKVVFSEGFNDPAGIAARWQNCSAPGKSSYETGASGLTVTIRNNPFRDGYIECDVPLIKRGVLEFDMEYPDPAGAKGIDLFVEIYNITNGERFATYAIRGERNSGVIGINGAAAHKAKVGDLMIIASYAQMTPEEAKEWHPTVIFPRDNRI